MSIVIRPLDRVFGALKIAIVPLLLLAAGLPMLRSLSSTSPAMHDNFAAALAGFVIVALYIGVLKTHAVGSRVNRLFAQVRRRVALACNHEEDGDHGGGRLACHLTAEVLRAPLFRYDDQRRAVSALAEACGAEPAGQFWFVEGKSGSGKTRTALLLVQTLVRDLALFELGSRCYLYDFADAPGVQNEFVRRLGSARHDGAVILVDNFQLVRPGVLRTLTTRLIDRPGGIPERLVVFLARPGDAWNLSPGSDVRLLSEAKAATRHLKLSGPSADAVANCVAQFDRAAADRLRALDASTVATAAQLHLAQVIARDRGVAPEVLEILGLLSRAPNKRATGVIVQVLALATALSMHRGAFGRREWWRAVRVASQERQSRSRSAHVLRLVTAFRRLNRVGLLTKIHVGGTRYIFHESVAELCIDRLSELPDFASSFHAVGRSRLRQLEADRDALMAWLVGVEIGERDVVESSFDGAISRGAYARMLRCLTRAQNRYALSGPVRLQLAILLDRVGDFAGSRAQVNDDLTESVAGTNDLAAVLATLRVETAHDESSQRALDTLQENSNRRVSAVADYWRLHIGAHRGRFAAEPLLALATEVHGLLGHNEGHWLTYSLGRMHFDSLRHHYLAGGLPTSAICTPERRVLDNYLRTRLPTYEALHVLYAKAHLVGHVLIPQLALYAVPVNADEKAMAELGEAEAASVDGLIAAAQRLYRRARDEFWQYGDREADYLQADILNADMIGRDADLDALAVRLHAYQRFIVGTGFDDLLSYPHFYFVRWHMLKYYAVLLNPGTQHARTADEHLNEARRHLRRVVDFDTAAGNAYGLLRAELLSLLLRGVRKPLDPKELSSLQRRMEIQGFGRESRLLSHMQGQPKLTSSELRAIFRFYPFVHQ